MWQEVDLDGIGRCDCLRPGSVSLGQEEVQRRQFLWLGQGLGLGPQLQEWGEAQGWSKGQKV